MKRKKPTRPTRTPSKWERDLRRRVLVEIIISIAIVAAISTVTWGLYATRIKPWHEVVVRVDDRAFDMNYFTKMFRLWGGTGTDTSTDSELMPSVVTAIEQYELIRLEAEARGVTASDQEIDDKIWDLLSSSTTKTDDTEFFANYDSILKTYGLTDQDLREMYIEPAVLQTKLKEAMGSEKYPEGGVFTHAKVQAILLGTKEAAIEAKNTWETQGFDALVNATSPTYYYPKNSVEWLPEGIENTTFDAYAFGNTTVLGAISDPVSDTTYYTTGGYWVLEVLTNDGTNLTVRAILLDSEAKAKDIRQQLIDGGDWTTLAADNSLDSSSKSNGGKMDSMTVSDAITKFTSKVAELEVGQLSDPIYNSATSKQSGYWLIKVVEKEDRQLTTDHRDTLTSTLYNNWLSSVTTSTDHTLKDLLDTAKAYWAYAHVQTEETWAGVWWAVGWPRQRERRTKHSPIGRVASDHG
ncbi:MAG: peptidylprolyl isomerase [Chloroflexi bacterium]|nr:peptidylprolyl isomerase [Chloroflexota bacterium]